MIEIRAGDARSLLTYAEAVLVSTVRNTPAPARPEIEILREPLGAFSTLRIRDELRGCIGMFASSRPLEAILDQVIRDSALSDHRFYPVNEHELSDIELELSLLSPARTVKSTQEIKLGTHGVILNVDGRRSVFLPEVATEQGWDLETTLSMLARKAGLMTDAWKSPGASFSVFNTAKIGRSKKEGGDIEVRFL
ncbi:MAG: AmmeMemoRadiSam system protein A [Spirochaetales bacterium]